MTSDKKYPLTASRCCEFSIAASPVSLRPLVRELLAGSVSLSNAVFGFALALIVPEITEVFRRDVRQSRKTRHFGHFSSI